MSGGASDSGEEHRIQLALFSGQRDEAVTLILRGYGREVLDYLAALHRSDDDAADVFSLFAEAIWKAAPSFRGGSSVRTWAYGIARRTSLRYRRDERRRRRRFQSFEGRPHLAEVEAQVRTETLSFLRTPKRTKLAALRASLSDAERELLLLRIDRKLAWNDLVLVLAEGAAAEAPSSEELRRRAARLRKQFQALKDRLRAAARADGLVTHPDASD